MAMFHRLLEQGENQPDLLVAALLHDIGKLRYRLNPLERAMVVLVKAINPEQAHRWGSLPPDGWDRLPGWRKAFIVAEQHAGWGAEMARQAGVSPLTETSDPRAPSPAQVTKRMLWRTACCTSCGLLIMKVS